MTSRRWRRRVAGVIGAGAVVWLAMAGWLLVVATPLASPDAIVVLASHEWERLPLTVALAERHPAALVLLTLPSEVTKYNCHECAHRAEWLEARGVAPERIRVLPLAVSGTYGEAVACREFVRHRPVSRLVVVTSPYHTRRALAVFRHAFRQQDVEIGVLPAHATSPARPMLWWAGGYDLWYVSYEWAATVYYALRYGIWAV